MLQPRPTSDCIILHETCGGATPTKKTWWDSEVWLYYLLISRYFAHKIVTCVKQNNHFFIILLYDLMLHSLINKILHVNIMEWHPTWLFWVYREYDSSYVGMGVRRKYPILTQ